MGHVGRFIAAEPMRFPRSSRVICRTQRGIEVGQVLSPAAHPASDSQPDGQLLRKVTDQDELLLERLEQHRGEAFDACTRLLKERTIPATLMDVEHLFDGQSVYFYFLGSTTPELDALTRELAATYEKQVQFHRFAQALSEGCGPDCGTEDAAGCGDACSSCAVVSACQNSGGAMPS